MDIATGTTAPARWLARLPEDAIRPDIDGLWRIELEDGWWTFATDGVVLVAERGVSGDLGEEYKRDSSGSVRHWLTPPAEASVRPVGALRDWAGPAEYPEAPVRWARIGKMGIDRNRLAQMLEALTQADEVRISFREARRQKDSRLGRAPMLMLAEAGDVRFLVMECADPSHIFPT